MKNLGPKLVRFADIKLPGDWQDRITSARVRELAADLEETPLLQRPAIRKADKAVIYGRDRLAAVFVRNAQLDELIKPLETGDEPKALVDVWDCTDEELERAERVENAFRRPPDVAARTMFVKQLAKKIADRDEEEPETSVSETRAPRKPGHPKTAKGKAREVVAARAGVTVAALKKQEQREAAREKVETAPQEPAPPPEPGAETKAELVAIDALLVQVKKRLTQLTLADAHLIARFPVQLAKEKLNEATAILRGMVPKAPCPYHSGGPATLDCAVCYGSGWATADQLMDVPAELKKKPAEPERPKKALQITDENGAPIEVE